LEALMRADPLTCAERTLIRPVPHLRHAIVFEAKWESMAANALTC
jgi:hypothetical protein